MEESDVVPIFRPGEKGSRQKRTGFAHQQILIFLPLVLLLALCFYAWHWKTVVVVEDKSGVTERKFSTLCRTVGDFLEKNGLEVGLYDQLDPDPAEKISNGQVIRIQRAFPVTLVVDGEAREIWTCSRTAAELLHEQGIVLAGAETISPQPDAVLRSPRRQDVKVVRVSRGGTEERSAAGEKRTAEAGGEPSSEEVSAGDHPESSFAGAGSSPPLDFTTPDNIFLAGDPDLSTPATENLLAAGDPAPTGDCSPEDSHNFSGEAAVVEKNTLSRGGRVYGLLASLEVSATAYCPGTPESGCPIDARGASQCTGFYNDGYTATGLRAVPGDGSMEHPHLVAVDPAVIPLKSLLYLEGYGFARAEDTGSAIKGKKIDILFGQHVEAQLFGRQKVKIYIIDPHFAPIID